METETKMTRTTTTAAGEAAAVAAKAAFPYRESVLIAHTAARQICIDKTSMMSSTICSLKRRHKCRDERHDSLVCASDLQ